MVMHESLTVMHESSMSAMHDTSTVMHESSMAMHNDALHIEGYAWRCTTRRLQCTTHRERLLVLLRERSRIVIARCIKGDSKPVCNARLDDALKSNHDTRQCLTTLYDALQCQCSTTLDNQVGSDETTRI
eukprot:1463709-Rhodomonas_salina.1